MNIRIILNDSLVREVEVDPEVSKPEEGLKPVSTALHPALFARLEKEALENDRTVSAQVRRILVRYYDQAPARAS